MIWKTLPRRSSQKETIMGVDPPRIICNHPEIDNKQGYVDKLSSEGYLFVRGVCRDEL